MISQHVLVSTFQKKKKKKLIGNIVIVCQTEHATNIFFGTKNVASVLKYFKITLCIISDSLPRSFRELSFSLTSHLHLTGKLTNKKAAAPHHLKTS